MRFVIIEPLVRKTPFRRAGENRRSDIREVQLRNALPEWRRVVGGGDDHKTVCVKGDHCQDVQKARQRPVPDPTRGLYQNANRTADVYKSRAMFSL